MSSSVEGVVEVAGLIGFFDVTPFEVGATAVGPVDGVETTVWLASNVSVDVLSGDEALSTA